MVAQEFRANAQIRGIGWSQFKVHNQPSQRDQQMQFEAEDGQFLASDFAKVRTMRGPIARCPWHQMKLDHWHWQTINGTLPVRGQIKLLQDGLPDQAKRIRQCSATAIEPTLRA